MAPPTTYTAEEDAAILATGYGQLPHTAKLLGRTLAALKNRRQLLRGQRERTNAPPRRVTSTKPVARPFARPAWFDENTDALAQGRR